jgi:heavy metal sensor kinase
MNFNFKSIHFKLTLWYVLVLTAILLAFGILVYFSLALSLTRNLDTSIQSQAEWIAGFLDMMDDEVDFEELEDELMEHSAGRTRDQYIQIRRGLGGVIYRSKQLDHVILASEEALRRASDNKRTLETIVDPMYGALRLVTVPVVEHGEMIYLVQVGAAFKEVQRVVRQLFFILLGSGIVALTVAVFGGRFLVRKALNPVDEITKTAKKIEAENLSQRLDVPPTGDELSRLASTLNEMIDRLDRSFRQVRQFTADASHELRTPLTVMRGQTEVALRKERAAEEYRQVLESNLEEMEWMSRIVENLLTLSRADSGQIQMEVRPVQLKRLVVEAYEECKALAEEKKLSVLLDKVEEATVYGDEMWLRQMLLNLVDNAVKYTPEGGKIWLSMEVEGGYVKLAVRDTGIGIPEEDLPRIFDRFYRVDKVRSREMGGSGLGLSIVQWIVNAYNGRVEVTSRLREGSCFTIWLDEVPEGVIEVVERVLPGGRVRGVERREEEGKVIYKVRKFVGGNEYKIKVTALGVLEEVKRNVLLEISSL